jgi:hypothetical protein
MEEAKKKRIRLSIFSKKKKEITKKVRSKRNLP